jgi:hypothetical protein
LKAPLQSLFCGWFHQLRNCSSTIKSSNDINQNSVFEQTYGIIPLNAISVADVEEDWQR